MQLSWHCFHFQKLGFGFCPGKAVPENAWIEGPYSARNFFAICGERAKSIAFWAFIAFLQHAPNKSSASKMEGFPQNSKEISQIINGEKVGSMQVKRSDPEED